MHRFGINPIDKDASAPLLDAQGQVQDRRCGSRPDQSTGGGNAPGDDETNHLDHNDQRRPAGRRRRLGHRARRQHRHHPGHRQRLRPRRRRHRGRRRSAPRDGRHTARPTCSTGPRSPTVPELGLQRHRFVRLHDRRRARRHGHGDGQRASCSRPAAPTGRRSPEPTTSRPGSASAVTIDVLANDIDPERDLLTRVDVPERAGGQDHRHARPDRACRRCGTSRLPDQAGHLHVHLPGRRSAGRHQPEDHSSRSRCRADARERATDGQPRCHPPAGRCRRTTLDVKANDVDPDGDDADASSASTAPTGSTPWSRPAAEHHAAARSAQLLGGHVHVERRRSDARRDRQGPGPADSATPRRTARPSPIADAERVVIGNSVKIPVTANDVDPDHDPIRLLTVERPQRRRRHHDCRRQLGPLHAEPPRHHRADTGHVHVHDQRRSRQRGDRQRHGHRAGRGAARGAVRPRRLRRHRDRQVGQHRRAGQRQRPVGWSSRA